MRFEILYNVIFELQSRKILYITLFIYIFAMKLKILVSQRPGRTEELGLLRFVCRLVSINSFIKFADCYEHFNLVAVNITF